MERRGDLYSLKDLTTPCVGEFRSLDDTKRFYARTGALIRAAASTAPTVSQCYRLRAPKKQDVNLVEILKECFSARNIVLRWRDQIKGTCVGQAGATASDIVMAVAWLIFDKKVPGRACVSTGYAGSRVEVAGRPGAWDGSNGSWIAEFNNKWGVAVLNEIGLNEDELIADERLAVQWAASREGVPEKFELITKTRPIIRAPQVKTAEELIACLESGNPVIHGSDLIPYDRNTNDTVPLYRGGGHCTVFAAIRWNSKGEAEILYLNSWGLDWGNQGCVWISLSDAVRILNQDDSYAYIGIQGLAPEIPLL